LLPFRQQPINRSNLILIGQALFKAINKLHRQKASSSANLDSPDLEKTKQTLHTSFAAVFHAVTP
jgi:hypothetical protein